MSKLYSAITTSGFVLIQDKTLEELEQKIDMDLNMLLEAERLEVGANSPRKLKIKMEKATQERLYSGRDREKYFVLLQRTL